MMFQPYCPGAGRTLEFGMGVAGLKGRFDYSIPSKKSGTSAGVTRGLKVEGDVCTWRRQTKVSECPPAYASCLERSPAAAWGVSIDIKGRGRCQMMIGLYKVWRVASDTTQRRAVWGRILVYPFFSLSPSPSRHWDYFFSQVFALQCPGSARHRLVAVSPGEAISP